MKVLINKIVATILVDMDNTEDCGWVYSVSTYIAILYSLISNGVRFESMDDLKSTLLCQSLHRRYDNLMCSFENVHQILSDETREKVRNQLDMLSKQVAVSDEFLVSDVYQYVKSYVLKKLNRSGDKSVVKKEGKHLLYATQFFTDTYMVRYLVDRILEIYPEPEKVLFVDPSSGGGNFLTYLYGTLYEIYAGMGLENISEYILTNNLLGYDLDSELSQIASLSLYILAYKKSGSLEQPVIYNFGGYTGDFVGTLNRDVVSTVINGKNYNDVITNARIQGKRVVFITNPPFMGRRDMATNLKNYIQINYPSAKGDLCFAFLLSMLRQMQEGDAVAVVSQNGWLNLSSMKNFRREIIDEYSLINCVDLGSNAFKNINGEKTNVILAIFRRFGLDKSTIKTNFVNLRSLSIQQKERALEKNDGGTYRVNISEFESNANLEFNYQFGDDLCSLSKYPSYGNYAKCMQGSSTGDNSTMVKYIWETNAEGWILTSKGGGFSKWQGLNYYKVRWGRDGECIKENKGGVLRNPSLIDSTELVYSDTGTMGLNVRLKLGNQVFIASGPGIKIISGDKYCHLAFLNSKIASFFMSVINPKFTTSGGYIQKLPVAEGILDNKEIRDLSIKCVRLKQEHLKSKLPNAEFVHDSYNSIVDVDSYLCGLLSKDIKNEYDRLLSEMKIESIIASCYNISSRLHSEYQLFSGCESLHNRPIDIESLDVVLSKMINDNCSVLGKKVSGCPLGSENLIRILSLHTGSSCESIYHVLFNGIHHLDKTIAAYKRDFVHKIMLSLVGVTKLTNVGDVIHISSYELLDRFKRVYPNLHNKLKLKEHDIKMIIETVHNKVFFNHPIIILK